MIKETMETRVEPVTRITKRQYFCDRCGGEIEHDSPYHCGSWKVKLTTGSRYPEGGNLEGKEAYFCETCSKDVEKALVDIGVCFTIVDRIW